MIQIHIYDKYIYCFFELIGLLLFTHIQVQIFEVLLRSRIYKLYMRIYSFTLKNINLKIFIII